MYKARITCKEGYLFEVETKDYRFNMGIRGVGATPSDALLASLGSCIGLYIRKYAEGVKLDLGQFDIKVEAELSQEKPVSFRRIDVSIDLKGLLLDERRRKSLFQFVKNCPVHNTFKSDPDINISID
ncbi:MAG: OsmC family protein [Candidatus Omnitrophica bacterium]|nr:OsmC family protein [Candidatus Omnitrophota bacterium]